jgi:hypothetical protein
MTRSFGLPNMSSNAVMAAVPPNVEDVPPIPSLGELAGAVVIKTITDMNKDNTYDRLQKDFKERWELITSSTHSLNLKKVMQEIEENLLKNLRSPDVIGDPKTDQILLKDNALVLFRKLEEYFQTPEDNEYILPLDIPPRARNQYSMDLTAFRLWRKALVNMNEPSNNDWVAEVDNRRKMALRNQFILTDSALSDSHLAMFAKVRKLHITSCGVASIPTRIFDLEHLELLDFGGNYIQTVPDSIGKSKKLRVLILDQNQIESIPIAIMNLVHLQILSLSFNRIKTLPESLSRHPRLTYLSLNFNHIERIPFCIKLKYLDLNHNPLLKFIFPPHQKCTDPEVIFIELLDFEEYRCSSEFSRFCQTFIVHGEKAAREQFKELKPEDQEWMLKASNQKWILELIKDQGEILTAIDQKWMSAIDMGLIAQALAKRARDGYGRLTHEEKMNVLGKMYEWAGTDKNLLLRIDAMNHLGLFIR